MGLGHEFLPALEPACVNTVCRDTVTRNYGFNVKAMIKSWTNRSELVQVYEQLTPTSFGANSSGDISQRATNKTSVKPREMVPETARSIFLPIFKHRPSTQKNSVSFINVYSTQISSSRCK